MSKIAENVLDVIGKTPLVRLNKLTKSLCGIVAVKLEYFNPSLSVKDRTAMQMIEDAERSGLIQPGKTVIVEPTSGNTGIGLAMIAAVKGYKCIIVMPESMSVERRVTMAAYGCEVVLTPAKNGMLGAIQKALHFQRTLLNVWIPQQFENPSNSAAHEQFELMFILLRTCLFYLFCMYT